MACRKVVLSTLPATALGQQVSRAFSSSTLQLSQKSYEETRDSQHRSARYLLEATERQQKERSGRLDTVRRDSQSGESEGKKNIGRFRAPPSIPYNTTKELRFADEIDWEITSVFKPRPIYANVAAGRGTVAPLGTIAVNGSHYNPLPPGTAFLAHLTGVRANGELDPEVEQSLIQDLAKVSSDESKDHRNKLDLPSTENHHYLFRLAQTYQEIMNPRNTINRFNNGNVKHIADIKYDDIGSDDLQTEKAWKRLELLGGDYTRASDPLSLLPPSGNDGANRKTVLDNVGQLLGQNRSIGLQDKKKLLKVVDKILGVF